MHQVSSDTLKESWYGGDFGYQPNGWKRPTSRSSICTSCPRSNVSSCVKTRRRQPMLQLLLRPTYGHGLILWFAIWPFLTKWRQICECRSFWQNATPPGWVCSKSVCRSLSQCCQLKEIVAFLPNLWGEKSPLLEVKYLSPILPWNCQSWQHCYHWRCKCFSLEDEDWRANRACDHSIAPSKPVCFMELLRASNGTKIFK